MHGKRKRSVTALTAAVALAVGVVPTALTTSSILAAGEGTTTLTPAGLTSAGSLELATSLTGAATITYTPATGPVKTQTVSASNCVPLVISGAALLTLTGEGLKGSSVSPLPVGLLKGGLGVQDKGTGTSCGRVDSGASEGLTVALGADAVGSLGLPVRASSARLDLDLKGGARVVATASGPGGAFVSTLISGSAPPGGPGAGETYCAQGSDSGPDSNANDNCDWTIAAPSGKEFTSLKLVATAGSFALSGGADYATNPAVHRTRFDLVEEADGELFCGDSLSLLGGTGGTKPAVNMTRLNNADPNDACDKVLYKFSNGPQSAELLKPLDKEPSAQFSFVFDWTVDPATITPGTTATSGPVLVPPTTVDFDSGGNLDSPTPIAWCPDLVPQTVTVKKADGTTETKTFLVVKDVATNAAAPDLAVGYPATEDKTTTKIEDTKQFACLVKQSSEAVDKDPAKVDGATLAKVQETVYVYGDIALRK